VRIAAIVDTETTGLDPENDALLELGITLVEYSPFTGRLYRVIEEVSWLQDPGRQIPLEITQLTGLTDDQVKGQMIPAALAESMIERASIVIAHNAGFDRLFLENFSPVFASKPWGCSIADIDWKGEGIASTKLDYLLFKMGWYFDGHRTTEDIRATLQLLSLPLPNSKRLAMRALLDQARSPTFRIWAAGAGFDTKDQLKARGYKWSAGEGGRPKSWYRDVAAADHLAEANWLADNVLHGRRPSGFKIDADSRYSDRCWKVGTPL
jgi:DNA polymerase-3 subunit epsilon